MKKKTYLNQKNNPICPGLELFQIGTASSISRKVIWICHFSACQIFLDQTYYLINIGQIAPVF